MFLDKLFKSIGLFFTGLFNAAKKVWKQLSPELQNAMLHASGVVNVVNSNLDKVPEDVWALIQKKFPELSEDKVKGMLQTAMVDLNIGMAINKDDILVLIQSIQTYLAGKTGTGWEKASHTIYLAMAVFLSPQGKIAAIVALAEYVYHDLIKGK